MPRTKKIHHCEATIERESNVFMLVCLCSQGAPISPLLMNDWTSPYREPLLVTTGGHNEVPVQTRSLEDPPHSDP